MVKTKVSDLLCRLSELFGYPYDPLSSKVEEFLLILNGEFPDVEECLCSFRKGIGELSVANLEEVYVKTFDVQATCCLDVGYVLYGEDYKRGQFMAEIRTLQRQHYIDTGSELPDHLPNLMNLLPCLNERDAREIVSTFIYPAVEKMNDALATSGSVYRYLLGATKALLLEAYQPEIENQKAALPVLQNAEASCR